MCVCDREEEREKDRDREREKGNVCDRKTMNISIGSSSE